MLYYVLARINMPTDLKVVRSLDKWDPLYGQDGYQVCSGPFETLDDALIELSCIARQQWEGQNVSQ